MSAPRQEARMEASEVCRLLMRRPWLLAGRDDAAIEAVHRFEDEVRSLVRDLQWRLVVEPDTVRLVKSPPSRLAGRMLPEGAACRWMLLCAAAIDGLPPTASTADLVASAREAAAEARMTYTGSRDDLRKLRCGIEMLIERGVVEILDGTLDDLDELEDADRGALLKLRHDRLMLMLGNAGPLNADSSWLVDPLTEPERWIEASTAEAATSARVLRRLVDDTVVHWGDLDLPEEHWLRTELNGKVAEVAESMGMWVEERAEGVALVLDGEHAGLRGHTFPNRGTVHHAAVLVRDHALAAGRSEGPGLPGPGWRSVPVDAVAELLTGGAGVNRWWGEEYRRSIPRLVDEVRALWEHLGLLRVAPGYTDLWWLSPAAARWAAPKKSDNTSEGQNT